MASYYQANEPYNRQGGVHNKQDSIWSGALIGAGIGAVGAGGLHASGGSLDKSVNKRLVDAIQTAGAANEHNARNGVRSEALDKDAKKAKSRYERAEKWNTRHANTFGANGTGLRKAGAYVGSALLGGIIGASADHFID